MWDLRKEWSAGEGVVMYQHPRNVSDDFEDQADDHGDGETPCSVPDSEAELCEDADAEEDGEEEVAAVGGAVEEVGLGETAGLEGTVIWEDVGVAVCEGVDGHGDGCKDDSCRDGYEGKEEGDCGGNCRQEAELIYLFDRAVVTLII